MIKLAKIHWHGNRVTGNRRVRLRRDDNAAQSGQRQSAVMALPSDSVSSLKLTGADPELKRRSD
jgi:hypothetical protein